MRTKLLKSAVATALLFGSQGVLANDGITAAGDWLMELFVGAMLLFGGVVTVIALLIGLVVCLSSAARRGRQKRTRTPSSEWSARSLLAGPTLRRQDADRQ